MSNTRNDISKLIDRIRIDNSLIDMIKPHAFESLVAEAVARNNSILEIQKHALGQLDYMGKIRDSLGHVTSFAVEAKRMKQLVDENSVRMLAAKTAALNIDRSFLVTNSGFTKAAIAAAKLNQSHLQLIDRSGLIKMLEQYHTDKNVFASSLFKQFNKLKLNNIVHLKDPEPKTLEDLDLSETDLEQSQKSALVAVDKLPLRLLTRILQSPNDVRNITPRQFEEFTAELLTELGFTNVILTPRSGDGGKDVIASHSINGIPLSFYFECKQYAEGNKIQLDTLRSLLGAMAHDARNVNKGVLVTTSTFTKGCHDFILAESRLDGKDYDGILGWVNELKTNI